MITSLRLVIPPKKKNSAKTNSRRLAAFSGEMAGDCWAEAIGAERVGVTGTLQKARRRSRPGRKCGRGQSTLELARHVQAEAGDAVEGLRPIAALRIARRRALEIRAIVQVEDLGHERPRAHQRAAQLLQPSLSPVTQHMLIENALSDAVRGFSTHRFAARWNAMHLRLSG